MNDEPDTLLPNNADQARQWIADLAAQLTQTNLSFRNPPEEPTSCCGRGCNGCVWEGYLHAAGYWCEQVREMLMNARQA
jgi:hypothetical protein